MATLQKFAKFTSGTKYFKEQIEYHAKQFVSEARKMFPELSNLSDSELLKNKEVAKKLDDNPYAPRWQGSLAKDFEVDGVIVDYESWGKFCGGYAPNADLLNNPEKLNGNPMPIDISVDEFGNPQAKIIEKEGKRIGTEIIFANSKEFSVLCAGTVGDQHKQLIEAKNRAVANAVNAMEQDIYVRKTVEGVSTKERGYGLMFVAYNHIENRGANADKHDHTTDDSEFTAEPFDHTHVVLGNTTKDKDGNRCALDNDLIMQNTAHYNSVYSRALTEELRAMGYQMESKYVKGQVVNEYMEQTEKGVLTMVPKMPEELIEHFSKRSRQIKSNGDGVRAREINQIDNKNSKTKETNTELRDRWQKEMVQIDPKFDHEFFRQLQNKEQSESSRKKLSELTSTKNWEDKLVDSFYEHHKQIACLEVQAKSYFEMKIHEYTDSDTAERMAEELFNKRFFAVLDKDSELSMDKLTKKPEDMTLLELENIQIELQLGLKFIDKNRAKEEKEMVESFYKRSEETKLSLDRALVEKVIEKMEQEKGYKLNHQQREAVFNQTIRPGAYALMSGRAGAGKSTSSEATFRAYKEAGFKVIGIGTSDKNTKGLQKETGIQECYNSEKALELIKHGKLVLDSKTILICDEMGMAGGKTWTRLVKEIDRAGAGAKFLGESSQLKAVSASGHFETFNSLNLNSSKLTIINRQKLDWQKEATEQFASGQGDVALKTYYDNGNINTKAKDQAEANRIAVATYMAVPEGKTKGMLTDTNENVCAINDQIRMKLKEHGIQGEDLATVKTKRFGDRAIALNEKITFKAGISITADGSIKQKNSKEKAEFKITNGQEATVMAVDQKNSSMTVQMDDGNWRVIKTNQKFDMNHSYCRTVHDSQGASIDQVITVPTGSKDLSLMYVACSRHKDGLTIVMNDTLKSEVAKKVSETAPSPKMVKLVEAIAKKEGIEVKPEMLKDFGATRDFLNDHAPNKIVGKAKHEMDTYSHFLECATQEQTKKTTMDYVAVDQSVLQYAKKEGVGTKFNIEQPLQIKARIDEEKRMKALMARRDGGVVRNINDTNRRAGSLEQIIATERLVELAKTGKMKKQISISIHH
jgi:conjugative relaxase-like TrwC/TraI family protein